MRDHLNLSGLPLWTVFVVFSGSALVILITGAKLTRVADRLADLTGIGEAMFGAVLLGATTSLPGIVTSVYTASAGFAQLSVSNAVGGIAAQTAFLAVADITFAGPI
jgi:cation:H+ antiporter